MWKIEGLFAEAKQYHGLARAKYRGRQKVQIQAYLSAIAQNLKRLVALFYYCLLVPWMSCPIRSAISTPISFQTWTFSTRPFVFRNPRRNSLSPLHLRTACTNTHLGIQNPI